MPRYHQGHYIPRHPKKYKGDVKDICYRSGLEKVFFRYCDLQPHILEWSSEPFFIPYVSPRDDRVHRYFPDIVLTVQDINDTQSTWMVEIKPDRQTRPPTQRKRITPRVLEEAMEYAVNQAKWESAKLFCERRGWVFKVITEKEINPKTYRRKKQS